MSHASPPQDNAATTGGQLAQWPRATRYLAAAFLILAIGMSLLFLVPVVSWQPTG